jgi:ATP-dependent helicase/nuclease subunit A
MSILAIPQKPVPAVTCTRSAAFVRGKRVSTKMGTKTLSSVARSAPPDQSERERALDPSCSILVQAPAGSGKTDLLTRRFLRLLAEVDDPSHIVAITFTIAAAAEMRHRIVSELEAASASLPTPVDDEFDMRALAVQALNHARALGWNLTNISGVLRISTIDSFCREIALRKPLLSTLAAGLEVTDQPKELYRLAARRTLLHLDSTDPARGPAELSDAIASLLNWRDNNWQELEDQIVAMLEQRDRWMQEFWLRDFHAGTDDTSWNELRDRLERPFARAAAHALARLGSLLAQSPGAWDEAVALARFACGNSNDVPFAALADCPECPVGPFTSADQIETARQVFTCLADLLLTKEGTFRQRVDKNHGFPPGTDAHKTRHKSLVASLSEIDGLQPALCAIRNLPPTRYSEDDWRTVRACFTLLRHAAAELHVAFAEAGKLDFTEIAQAALQILQGDDGNPGEAALAFADGIHHLLVDEFQDTSRRQHALISAIAGAWPDPIARTLFVVGDPMQSIYFFRDADAELFPRVQLLGFDLPGSESLVPRFVRLSSNFRTTPELVLRLNDLFQPVFAVDDGSNVRFSPSVPARSDIGSAGPRLDLHLRFVPQNPRAKPAGPDSPALMHEAAEQRAAALDYQAAEIVELIRSRAQQMENARANGQKYRIAVLGRARAALARIAAALRTAAIPFRAIDLEPLAERPEIVDAIALARALANPEDRLSWLGVLRAPWCGLSLSDLYTLAGNDDPEIQRQPIPDLMRSRAHLLTPEGRVAVERLQRAIADASALRAAVPGISLGTWLEQVWLRLGGDGCVDATARANLSQLWRCLDQLPAGPADLQGPSLQAALSRLTAQPDPSVDSSCGVQLMTIHKSKGLEFEVVIIPELQAKNGKSRPGMFAWLERALDESGDSDEVTEFLIAPFQPRGSDRGKTREWVDAQYCQKEKQETRRILYVAATRAREELHLFARPAYKMENGEPALCQPADGLLATAWPAIEPEARKQFKAWLGEDQTTEVEALAASASNVVTMPAAPRPALLRRLPSSFEAPPMPGLSTRGSSTASEIIPLYERHEGGRRSRALGSAVHRAFEILARLRSSSSWEETRAQMEGFSGLLTSSARALGFDRDQAGEIAAQALQIALRAAGDPVAQWILAPHAGAASEIRWTGVLNGAMRTVQADRVFRAGKVPLSNGDDSWWIIDYKTAGTGQAAESISLPALRAQFAPQLDLYAQVLRKLHGKQIEIRTGLYYPHTLQFDWWEP